MTERQTEKAREALYAASFAESRKEKALSEYKPKSYPWRVDIAILVLFALIVIGFCVVMSGPAHTEKSAAVYDSDLTIPSDPKIPVNPDGSK